MTNTTRHSLRRRDVTAMHAIPLSPRAWRLVAAVSIGLVSSACGRQSPAPHAAAPATPLRSDEEIRELDIAFYADRVQRDPTGGSDLARLGALYLARARETGDPHDVLLAEEAARHSLSNRAERNGAAASVLQSSLLAQHRFDEALHLAVAARDAEPDKPRLRAAVGEIQMELGQYDSARVAFAELHAPLGDLTIAPRLARWAEIEGQPERALRMLRAALAMAKREPTLPREQLAWYHLRVGDVELRTGRPVSADSAYLAGLAVHPGDYRILSALSHSALVQRRWRDAIAYGEQAIARTLDPATLGTLSDAYAAAGDSAKSAEYAHVLDVAVLRQPGAYHRAWSLFLLDHDRHVATVSRKIREELRTRRDIYAYDLLAWSLHKQGRDRDAAVAMKSALAQGTVDAQLFYHAGIIERAGGNADSARVLLERALAVNPYFHPSQVADARAVLASLPPRGDERTVATSPLSRVETAR
ncbi:MAG TPA: tetratricopeptide repeat protein [Gemmatimonadaceae bacterium]|nr:tetratricopeptide repeat protein [Gemmatimonadaceae bacterium]